MRAIRIAAVLACGLAMLANLGCIVVEQHEWNFELNANGSGEGTLIFHHLACDESEQDSIVENFTTLIHTYYQGDGLAEQYPGLTIAERELFVEQWNGREVLSGKIVFTFGDYGDVGLYHYAPKDILLLSAEDTHVSSNGLFLGDEGGPPVVLWEGETDEIQYTTTEEPTMEGEFLEIYRRWLDEGEDALLSPAQMGGAGSTSKSSSSGGKS